MSPLLSVEDAQAEVLGHVQVGPVETVSVKHALGRISATPLRSSWPLPQAAVSVMDGYAARAEDLAASAARHVDLRLIGESAAGHPSTTSVGAGEAVRISTGAVLPEGADLVVPREDCQVQDQSLRVDLQAYGEVSVGRWVRPRGCDLEQDEVVLQAGTRLGPAELAAAAATGHPHLQVHRRPDVAILSTGDELVAIGEVPAPGQVVSTNGLMLADQVRRAGGTPHDLGVAPDERGRLRAALEQGLRTEVFVTTGGASVGEHDLVAEELLAAGCTRVFHGVAVKPGKPTGLYLGPLQTLVFVLPGNPASALVTFELLVRPALRRMLGLRGASLPRTLSVRLRTPAPGAGARAHYVRARLHDDGTASVLLDQRSGNLKSITDFDALVIVPAGQGQLPVGAAARALIIDPWWYESRSSS